MLSRVDAEQKVENILQPTKSARSTLSRALLIASEQARETLPASSPPVIPAITPEITSSPLLADALAPIEAESSSQNANLKRKPSAGDQPGEKKLTAHQEKQLRYLDPAFRNRKENMAEYIKTTDVTLAPTMVSRSLDLVFGQEAPRTLFKNSDHIQCVFDNETKFQFVFAYYPRCTWLKRLGGKLRAELEKKNFKQEKLITPKPGFECFTRYVPEWVDSKSQKETFASLFLLFVNNGERVTSRKRRRSSSPLEEGTESQGSQGSQGSSEDGDPDRFLDKSPAPPTAKRSRHPNEGIDYVTLAEVARRDEDRGRED